MLQQLSFATAPARMSLSILLLNHVERHVASQHPSGRCDGDVASGRAREDRIWPESRSNLKDRPHTIGAAVRRVAIQISILIEDHTC